MKLSNQPPKGTSDWFPEEYAIRKYIFDTWRKICTSFGYEEYLSPIIESADVYRAKSGEDVGGKELMVMTDRAGRELAIRPEMTPSVTRMVSKVYESSPKPIRYFSIANFLRNEKPQRGRNREFWQLNFDIFGSDSINADIEIIQMAIEILKSFGASQQNFIVYINDRDLIVNVLIGQYLQCRTVSKEQDIVRLIDKFDKLERSVFMESMRNIVNEITDRELATLILVLQDDTYQVKDFINRCKSVKPEFFEIIAKLEELGYGDYIKFKPSMVRGFDYYDGMVFEVFDKNPDNNRAMFGGGRYNGLAGIFGSKPFPAVGCAPGDETTKLFLESWNLLQNVNLKPETYYLPVLNENLLQDVQTLAQKLRGEGLNIIAGLETEKLGKALDFANKKQISNVIIFGEDEKGRGVYQIKNMKTGEQKEANL
jgi:histidyl-tRNA synthetase